jgi:hypothetical protein
VERRFVFKNVLAANSPVHGGEEIGPLQDAYSVPLELALFPAGLFRFHCHPSVRHACFHVVFPAPKRESIIDEEVLFNRNKALAQEGL